MENLHLKNLKQKQTGLIILKQLSNPNNNYCMIFFFVL